MRNIIFFHKWLNKPFSEVNKVTEHFLKEESWQGPPHINIYLDWNNKSVSQRKSFPKTT